MFTNLPCIGFLTSRGVQANVLLINVKVRSYVTRYSTIVQTALQAVPLCALLRVMPYSSLCPNQLHALYKVTLHSVACPVYTL